MIQEYSERNATSGHRVSLRVMVRGSLEATLTIEYRKETYMIVREYLDGTNPEQYHIFDSHQEMMGDRGVDHKDQDYLVYSYNVHKNNKPKAGDVFLYRRPGKSTANRKFNIYGGGVIARITEPDREGNVLATITTPFRL